MLTRPDVKNNRDQWMQRSWLNNKYTWTFSGVLWNNVKERCKEGSKTQNREPTYIGSENRFKDFQTFAEWHIDQVGYGLGYDLDSDILRAFTNKVYSEDTCLLIPSSLNRFLQSCSGKRSNRPQGVGSSRGFLYVKPSFTYLEHEEVKYKYRSFKIHELHAAKDYYEECKNYFAGLWVTRLKSPLYTVDERVVQYMENWRHVDEGLYDKNLH